ncbi:MAG: GIY-YIG nuclease family protein [Patescibacteria group bacterium]
MYVLKMNNDQLYFGFAPNLKEKIQKHNKGKVFTTKKYLPVKLIYYECYISKKDAMDREYKLKRFGSTWRHLKKRISNSI